MVGVNLDQVVIANHLGVILPEGYDHSELLQAGVTNVRFDSDPNLWGIEPLLSDINAVLRAADTRLACTFESVSKFQDWEFEEWLGGITKSGVRPIIGFDYNSLFGKGGEPQGHCVVGYHIETAHGRCAFRVYDPGPHHAGIHILDSEDLYYACRKKAGGIWAFTAEQS